MAVIATQLRNEGVNGMRDEADQGTEGGQKKRRTTKRDGAARLKRAMDQQVALHVDELAKLLTDKALHGDIPTARLMVALAEEGKPAPKKKKRRGPTMAERWAASPEWKGEPAKEGAELGGGYVATNWGMAWKPGNGGTGNEGTRE